MVYVNTERSWRTITRRAKKYLESGQPVQLLSGDYPWHLVKSIRLINAGNGATPTTALFTAKHSTGVEFQWNQAITAMDEDTLESGAIDFDALRAIMKNLGDNRDLFINELQPVIESLHREFIRAERVMRLAARGEGQLVGFLNEFE